MFKGWTIKEKKTKYREVSSTSHDNIDQATLSFYNLEEANSSRKEKFKVKIIKFGYNDNKRLEDIIWIKVYILKRVIKG